MKLGLIADLRGQLAPTERALSILADRAVPDWDGAAHSFDRAAACYKAARVPAKEYVAHERAAAANCASIHMVNVRGSLLVAPFGGVDRRGSQCQYQAGNGTCEML